MKEKYKVSNIFNETEVTFNELISTFLFSFLDKEFTNYENKGIRNTTL